MIFKKFIGSIFFFVVSYFFWKLTSLEELKQLRLVISIEPLHYEIVIQPFVRKEDGLRRNTFHGDVHIQVKCNAHTRDLMIHGKDFTFYKAEYWNIRNADSKNRLIRTTSFRETNILRFKFLRPILKGNSYIIHFEYTGKINMNDTRGLYCRHYKNNTDDCYLATHSEPIFAREIFPCFDEPKYKATFRLSLIRHKSIKKSYSNTRVQQTVSEPAKAGEYVRDIFHKTPPISTYVLNFIMGNFTEFSRDEKSGVDVRIVTEFSNTVDEIQSKLDLSERLVNAFSEYFAWDFVDLGIDQLQLASMHSSHGSIENLGSAFFNGDDNGKLNTLALAHEIAHMWLVTCDWWAFNWLQEGFATYLSTIILNEIIPDSPYEYLFVMNGKQKVMAFDAVLSNSNHPLNFDAKLVPSVAIFDEITFFKGAAFIRMVSGILGERKFRKSLQEYLRTFQHKSVKPIDLFLIWEKYMPEEAKPCAQKLFQDYSEQVGYALVSMSLTNDGNGIFLSQKRFLEHHSNMQNTKDTEWIIPLTYQTDKNLEITTIFYNCQSDLSSSSSKNDEASLSYFKLTSKNVRWIIANVNSLGYYRVNYDLNNWKNVKEALLEHNWSGIGILTRSQIVDDLFALSFNNIISYELALDILEFLRTEINYFVWRPAFRGFLQLFSKVNINELIGFSDYLRNLTGRAYDKMKSNNEFSNCITLKCFEINEQNHLQILSFREALCCIHNEALMEEHILGILTNEEMSSVDQINALKMIYKEDFQNNLLILLRVFQKDIRFCIKSLKGIEQFTTILIDILENNINDDAQLAIVQEIIERLDASSSRLVAKALSHANEERRFWKIRMSEIQKYLKSLLLT